jgi:hypothetical protein
MDSLEELKRKRFLFMKRLYELSGASPLEFVLLDDILKGLDIGREEAINMSMYLSEKGLMKFACSGPYFNITSHGIDQVEAALAKPELDNQYFGPIFNILNVGSVQNSQIQQGSVSSTQSAHFDDSKLAELMKLLPEFRAKAPDLQLSDGQLRDFNAHLDTIEAQLKLSRPRPSILKESLTELKYVLESAAGSLVAAGLLAALSRLM